MFALTLMSFQTQPRPPSCTHLFPFTQSPPSGVSRLSLCFAVVSLSSTSFSLLLIHFKTVCNLYFLHESQRKSVWVWSTVLALYGLKRTICTFSLRTNIGATNYSHSHPFNYTRGKCEVAYCKAVCRRRSAAAEEHTPRQFISVSCWTSCELITNTHLNKVLTPQITDNTSDAMIGAMRAKHGKLL